MQDKNNKTTKILNSQLLPLIKEELKKMINSFAKILSK